MTIKKLENGQYEVDIRPAGRHGKRIRRRFEKKQFYLNVIHWLISKQKIG